MYKSKAPRFPQGKISASSPRYEAKDNKGKRQVPYNKQKTSRFDARPCKIHGEVGGTSRERTGRLGSKTSYTQKIRTDSSPSTSKIRTQHSMRLDENELNHMRAEFLRLKKRYDSMKPNFINRQDRIIKLHTSLVELHDQIMKLGGTDLEVDNLEIVAFSHTQYNKKKDEVD
ncbi:uncharacterized protein LOC110838324 [Zootermopsis nevadensis]|uniref:Uncharacterized protein n=1 Tax=Zootermopsis nevadensis TaxID=136037 RepID=A0A067QYK6_ZOONE|nr:uncharacterized protein LOC110838324 [Zootermopsis nevadensis]KDR10040.1 hypothetical protein L798_15702 [Zootermopsis nevadensis]